MLIAADPVVARSPGIAAEKTKAAPLIRCKTVVFSCMCGMSFPSTTHLVMSDVFHPGAKSSTSIQTDSHRADENIDLGSLIDASRSVNGIWTFMIGSRLTGTFKTSVTPRPCFPTIPNE
jgi:hypothetical protein